MVSGTPQLIQMGADSPHNKWPCLKSMWPIQSHVSMTSSFLMELKEGCHTCMDGFTTWSLLPRVMVHSFIFPWSAMEEGAKIGAKSLIRHQESMQSGCFSCHIGGLIARQVSMTRYPAKHNTIPWLLEMWNLAWNLNDYGLVCRETMETLKDT
jgi:hypothetical protein